jgi:hypothetical protein
MRYFNKKESSERYLMLAVSMCLFCGLACLAAPALTYLKHRGDVNLRASPFLSSVPIETYDTVADLAHWLMFTCLPIIGFSFLIIGYLTLRAYHRAKLCEKS